MHLLPQPPTAHRPQGNHAVRAPDKRPVACAPLKLLIGDCFKELRQ
jgi:hypothetical protein